MVAVRRLLPGVLLALSICSSTLQAQQISDDEAAEPPKPVLAPPQLETFVEPTFPPEAMAQGLTARVELELLIGIDGRVQDLKVLAPAGHGFDEAAIEAGRQLIFQPATADGKPIPAKIRFPFVFELAVESVKEEPDAPPPPATLSAQVLSESSGAALAGVEVSLSNDDGSQVLQAETDVEGRFSFTDLSEGGYFLRLLHPEYEAFERHEDLLSGQTATGVYRLRDPPDPEAFGAVARIPPPPREVTRRSIGKQQLTRIPGTRGDAIRTVELMPGVARPPLGAGALIVRGSSPADTQALFEGLPIPILFHFGGLTSFINSRLLESIEFYPGNFSVRYGRRRGGIVEVRASDPPTDAFHGIADINLIDASVLAQAPFSEHGEITLAARRSYFDVLFESLVPSEDISTIAAPVYYDYQGVVTYRPSERDKVRLMVFGSSDEFALLFSEPSDTDSAIAGDLDFATQFHRVHGSWRRSLSKDVDQDIDLAVGYLSVDLGLGEAFKFNLSGNDFYGRAEWRARITPVVRIIGGLDVFVLPGDFLYEGPPVVQTEGNPENGPGGSGFANRDRITARDSFDVVQPAIYVESDLNLDPLRVILGARVDHYSEIDSSSFDPRVSAHLRLTDDTAVKAGVGVFSQPPQFQESSPKLGNPELEPTRAVHVGTGVEQELAEGFSLGVDGFYKHMFRNIVGTEFGQAPFFTNGGEGRVYGAEFSLRVDPKGRFFGYLSYTLSRSERKDRGDEWRLFDFDQPHILTASAVYRLGKGWEAGATFRLVSGNPNTPILGSSFNASTGQYSPIFGAINSQRNPAFNRLDIRVEKQWKFEAWKLALYLDLQNVYNAENPEGEVYDFEFREKTAIRGLPIIPNLGLRGEM